MDMPPTVHLVDHIPQFPITDDVATDDDDDETHNVNYQPISAFDDGSDSDNLGNRGTNDAASPIPSNGVGVGLFHFQHPNPRFFFLDADSALTAMDLNGGGGSRGDGTEEDPESEEAEEEEEERMRQLEAAISRAFSEDGRQRSAPLAPENAARVVDAMKEVIFLGIAPDWAVQVPEDEWVDRLRRLRGESSSNI